MRPLWTEEHILRQLFEERRGAYEFAHVAVDPGDARPGEAARELARLVRDRERER